MDLNIDSNDFELGEIAREYAIQEALLTALDRAEQQADEQQLYRDVISHTVECCMQSCASLVEMTFVTREAQPLDPDPLSENSWQPDTEASPCAPDTWMRGVIQIKKPQPVQLSSTLTGEHQTSLLHKHLFTGTKSVTHSTSIESLLHVQLVWELLRTLSDALVAVEAAWHRRASARMFPGTPAAEAAEASPYVVIRPCKARCPGRTLPAASNPQAKQHPELTMLQHTGRGM